MGLCRCPRRKVTTQFCYEHRVNVCESCMVEEHPNCIVQGYLQWLKDSDYEPICTLCRKELAQDECIRLLCYHVFHWRCLDEKLQHLPNTIAPAGYTCPTCSHEVIPRDNVASPVAHMIRKKIEKAKWAMKPTFAASIAQNPTHKVEETSWSVKENQDEGPNYLDVAIDKAGSSGMMARTKFGSDTSSKVPLLQSRNSTSFVSQNDGEDKYKRKPFTEKFHRWFQSKVLLGLRRRDPMKRLAAVTVGTLVLIIVVVYFFSRIGRSSAFDDISLNPESNADLRNNM